MLGTKVRQFIPIPSLSLEELVPADHFYRHLEQVLDLTFVRYLVQDTYATTGRPSVDPVVFFKRQLVMFFEGIRSERHLMLLVADRLSVRWYLGYNLGEPLPDHSSLTRIRSRYGLAIFRRFFEAIVEQCQRAGLVWGEELYFDATHVLADAALDSLTARFAVDARAAMQAHVDALFPAKDLRSSSEHAPESAAFPIGHQYPDTVCQPAPLCLPQSLPEPLREELAQTQATRHDWIAQEGRPQREVRGRYLRTADVRISTTDPDATPLRLKDGGTHLGYQTHYVVDGGKRRIILGVLVTPGEVMENQPMLDLAWHVRFRWKLHPKQVTGDTTYGTVENIQALEDMGIRAYLPLPDWEHKTAYYGASHFVYDSKRDVYVCPQGQLLRPHHFEEPPPMIEYRADPGICPACPVNAACTSSPRWRAVQRLIVEAYLERVRAYHQTQPYQKAIRKRKIWVEPLFAEGKQWHQMRRFRLRRLWRVDIKALLIATGQNLMRRLQRRGWGRRPFPGAMAATTDRLAVVGYSLLLSSCGTERPPSWSPDVAKWMSP